MKNFTSMPNFRKLGVNKNESQTYEDIQTKYNNDDNFASFTESHTLYRSSKPDYLTPKEFKVFLNFNFKTIIDFRSFDEYSKGDGDKLIDEAYTLYKVKVPQWRNYNPGEELILKRIKTKKRPVFYNPNTETENETEPLLKSESSLNLPYYEKRHILINFFNLNLIWNVFNRIPLINRIISLFYLAYDFIMGTEKRYFVRYFSKKCLNSQGIKGLYIDIINLGQAPICAALKLLSIPSNFPVMLNCAHGKDRTGIISALVLSILGYPKEYIINDFARSEAELEPIRKRVVSDIVDRMHVSMSFTEAKEETMEHLLNYIDQNYGGVTSYLEKIGFTIAEQTILKQNLTTPPES